MSEGELQLWAGLQQRVEALTKQTEKLKQELDALWVHVRAVESLNRIPKY